MQFHQGRVLIGGGVELDHFLEISIIRHLFALNSNSLFAINEEIQSMSSCIIV